jgi:AraC-like DNA-binding protein
MGTRRRSPSRAWFSFRAPPPTTHRLRADDGDGADLVRVSNEFGTGFGNPLIQGPSALLVLPLREAPAIDGVLDALLTEAFAEHSGRDAAPSRLSEAVPIHLLRHADECGLLQSGVVAGLADARLAQALNAMHAEPARPWTLQGLAALASLSHARFAAHFNDVVGQPAGRSRALPMKWATAARTH